MRHGAQLHTVPSRPRSIAILGGSFDPVHIGHLAAATAAQRRFHLDEVHFVPTGQPPRKSKDDIVSFPHRYAMVALACAEHVHFVASLAEAGDDFTGRQVFYSVDTVRHFRLRQCHPHDRLYFILGADAFLEIPTWRSYETLLDSCDFIVVSRPGFRMQALRLVIPPELLGRPAGGATPDKHTIPLRRSQVYLLDTVTCHVSSSEVRRRLHRHQSIRGLVPPRVEEYIHKQALYR